MGAVVVVVVALHVSLAIDAASHTFGVDYLAYDAAARRLVAGHPPYDLTLDRPGMFGLFYYPPPFLLLVAPLTIFDSMTATRIWLIVLIGAYLASILAMPVRPQVRLLVLLLGGISWPLVTAIKLGQVGPLLMLAFALGWRWLDRPFAIGSSIAFGALVKIQPVVVFAWMVAERRWKSLAWGLLVVGCASAIATLFTGGQAWLDFLLVLRRAQDPITMPQNFTPGATAYYLGASPPLAAAIQAASTIGILLVVLASAIRKPGEPAFLVAVVASQLLSTILWDHYALQLLLPVAWLLERRRWWALMVPLSQAYMLVHVTPPIAYLIGFYAMLLAPLLLAAPRTAKPVESLVTTGPTRGS